MIRKLNRLIWIPVLAVVPLAFADTVVSTCDEIHLRSAVTAGGNVTFTCSGTIQVTSPLTLTVNTSIDGTGQNIIVSGSSLFKIMIVQAGVTASMNHLTLTNGSAIQGGAITNSGILTLNNTVLSNNTSTGPGGALYNTGTVTGTADSFLSNTSGSDGGALANNGVVTLYFSSFVGNKNLSGAGGAINLGIGRTLNLYSSVLSGNQSPSGDGGAIYNFIGSTNIYNSTLSGNTAAGNGGAINNQGTLVITNSTISGNNAGNNGGAISNGGPATATFVTFFGNGATAGGGNIFNGAGAEDAPGQVNSQNTIFAGATSGGNCLSNGGGVNDFGYNLDDGSTCLLSNVTSFNNTNPMLGLLAANGGPTQTVALLSGSPAIDVIPPGTSGCGSTASNPVTVDQRGIARPQGSGCDIGAFEFQPGSGNSGEIDGRVTDANLGTLAGAPVQVCSTDTSKACAFVGVTDSSGNYMAAGLADGQYIVTAYAPAGSVLVSAQATATVSNGSHITGVNIKLGVPAPPPPFAGFSPTHGAPTDGGVPAIFYLEPTTLTANACIGGTGTYQIVMNTGILANAGIMTETPLGSGHYTALVPPLYPNHGAARVFISITCNGTVSAITFQIYIDPSGVVTTQFGLPIPGATVTLLRSGTLPGPYATVPNGSAFMSPANRRNPDTTDLNGVFGWDVTAGFYEVTASAIGCSTVTSSALMIPPAATGIQLTVTCPVTGAAPASGSTCNGTYTGTFKGDLKISNGQNCTFVSGGVIGDIEMRGGKLTLSHATVAGDVHITGGSFSMLPATIVKGDLEIQVQTRGSEREDDDDKAPATPASATNSICGTSINGNFQASENGVALQIGAGTTACPGNTFSHNVEIHENSAKILVLNNVINGNASISDNRTSKVPAIVVVGNTVSGHLACNGNSSIIGGPNNAHVAQGQCK